MWNVAVSRRNDSVFQQAGFVMETMTVEITGTKIRQLVVSYVCGLTKLIFKQYQLNHRCKTLENNS